MSKFFQKTIVLLACLFLAGHSAQAQNWLTSGNTNVTNLNYLGTSGNQTLSIRTSGIERMRILNNSNLGYVCINPGNLTDAQLKNYGPGVTVGNHLNLIAPNNTGWNNQIRFYYTNALRHVITDDGSNLLIQPGIGGGASNILKIEGRIQIGNTNTPAGYSLYVDKGILAQRVKVAVLNSSDWSDYVFSPMYRIMPLGEVEKFVNQNQHLPNMPSAAEVVKNGIDVAKMDAKLLEKIEELTLYLIEIKKENEYIKKQISAIISK